MEETQSNSLLSTLSGNTLVTETGVIDRAKVPIYDHGIIALFEKEIGTGGICAGLFFRASPRARGSLFCCRALTSC